MSLASAVKPRVHTALSRTLRPAKARAFQRQWQEAHAAARVLVNIGCGGEPLDGFINTDVVWQAPAYLDLMEPWPVPEGSVDLVYADNVIEHFTLEDGRRVFRHVYEALKPGGVFRLATPDVEAVARQYLENGELARSGMERNREMGRDFIYPVQLIREVFCGAKHYLGFCYDYASIRAEMEAVGFSVERVPAGRSEYPELVGREVRMHPAEQATALIVEGRRS
jgi:predicted SAM-dependent methyltransferase